MTTNPERPYVPEKLYACHLVGGGFLADDVIDVVVLASHETDGPVAEYVLASVAESEPRRLAEALASEERRAQAFMEAWEKAKAEREEWQRLHAVVAQATMGHKARAIEAEKETDAVRRERDALLAERDAVAREGWRACVLGVSIIRFWQGETKSRSGDQRGALALMNEAVALRDIFTAGDKAAGKGVG